MNGGGCQHFLIIFIIHVIKVTKCNRMTLTFKIDMDIMPFKVYR